MFRILNMQKNLQPEEKSPVSVSSQVCFKTMFSNFCFGLHSTAISFNLNLFSQMCSYILRENYPYM